MFTVNGKWIDGGSPQCIENYDSCESYKGDDKKTCINIVLNTPNKCELKHDLTCKEGDLSCSSATNEAECKMAKPSTNLGKKCIYYDGTCHEEYAKCGDYKGTNPSECQNIKLFNGKKCVYEDSKCKTKLKECSEALDKNECELLFKLGVDDQEYYRCNWDESRASPLKPCYKDYMYCSDYKDSDNNVCSYIKPYDKSTGTYIEPAFKCEIKESTVNCERVLKECEDASTSAAICKSISENLEPTSNKYCAFIGGTCTTQYKTCGSFVFDSENSANFVEDCKKIIPKNYETKHCISEDVPDSNDKRCVEEDNECDFYNYNSASPNANDNVNYSPTYWESLCKNIGESCIYNTGTETCSEAETISCTNIKFISIKDENLNICKNNRQVSEDYNVCTLSRDRLKCEEFNKIINTPISLDDLDKDDNNNQDTDADTSEETNPNDGGNNNNDNSNNNNNYSGKKLGVGLIFIMLSLCLLF